MNEPALPSWFGLDREQNPPFRLFGQPLSRFEQDAPDTARSRFVIELTDRRTKKVTRRRIE
jgi:hypothetical protein